MPSPPSAPPRLAALRCVFSAVLEGKHAVCEWAACGGTLPGRRVHCASPLARVSCGEFAALLEANARFALGPGSTGGGLPRQRLRIRAGGLAALAAELTPNAPAPNVHALLRLAQGRWGPLAQLPFDHLMPGIAGWGRKP